MKDTGSMLIPTLVAAFLAGAVPALAQLEQVATWSGQGHPSAKLAWGDMDGDGDLDLAVANIGTASVVYLNDGTRLQASPSWASTETDDSYDVAWGDVDGDGDLDLAVGNSGAANRVYKNLGTVLETTASWSSTEVDQTRRVAWGDMDGDGDLDLAAGNRGNPNRVYMNSGTGLGTTAAWSSSDSANTVDVAWGRYNAGPALDLAAAAEGAPPKVYINTSGTILDVAPGWTAVELGDTRSVAWGDWDSDGDQDLAIGAYGLKRVYVNSGTLNTASAWASAEIDSTNSVAWGDWDGDGDLDLAAGNVGENRVYRNTGSTLAPIAAYRTFETDSTGSIAWGDWDGDGDLDLAAGNGGFVAAPDRVYLNSGPATGQTAAWTSTEAVESTDAAWGDVDGDGDLDLAVAVRGGRSLVYFNVSGRLVSPPGWQSDATDPSLSVAWGDVDGDGDLDLAVGNLSNTIPNRLYLNLGPPGFLETTASWRSTETLATTSVRFADWDGDGDLDLAVGNLAAANQVYINQGTGLETTASWASFETADLTRSIAWGDWDGDGDLDLAVGNDSAPNRVYRNSGTGLAVVAAWSSPEIPSDKTKSVDWGDWDGDGDLDLAAGIAEAPNRVYENFGGSLVSAWRASERDATTQSVAWGDWDGDGDVDLAVGNGASEVNRIYRNIGGDLDPIAAWTSTEAASTLRVAWGDVDGDGDLELLAANDGADHLYHNHTRPPDVTLPDNAGSPLGLIRPGTTNSAYFYSTPELLSSPIAIDYTLIDEESDRVAKIIPEFALGASQNWRPATQAAGGDPITALMTNPTGLDYTFMWDADADGAGGDGIRFRIAVAYQAPDYAGFPIQRPALRSVSPPFRMAPIGCAPGTLTPLADLIGWKSGGTAASFRWSPGLLAIEYHLNSVLVKTQLNPTDPKRSGLGVAQCEVFAPAVTCVDANALSDGQSLVFYQALAACSAAVEGPVF